MDSTSAAIAKALLHIEAVKLSPNNLFTWTSGIKSPIYCDNRATLSYPEVRSAIADGFVEMVNQHFPDITHISGVATAGIAHGALLADRLGLPYSYIRSSAKGHGLKNRIEGRIQDGDKVLVIEDLISTGKSSLEAVDAIHEESKAEVVGLAAIFTYGFQKAIDRIEESGILTVTLSNYDTLVEVAEQAELVEKADIEMLKNWVKTM